MEQLIKQIEQWAEDRNIINGSKPIDQAMKLFSEFGELAGVAAWVNGAFYGFEQAKAQAVPDGFVLMPMVPSERMIHAVRQCYEGEAYLPYSLYSEFVNQAIIERMEAQETAND